MGNNALFAWLLFSSVWVSTPALALRVFFIGNSYTYLHGVSPSLPTAIADLARRNGKDCYTEMEASPMISLATHLKKGSALKRIGKGNWDVVVLQENSKNPISYPQTMHDSIKTFDWEIKKIGAKTLLYLTWELSAWPGTGPMLEASYFSIAQEIGARVAPVGVAWRNYETLYGDLIFRQPDFSSHATRRGAYLAALVFYVSLFEERPWAPSPEIFGNLNLSAIQIERLVEIAVQTVNGGLVTY